MSHNFSKNLVGNRYGRLVVERFVPNNDKASYWECLCDCGSRRIVRGNSLVSGHTASCGCLLSERNISEKSTHRLSKHPLYRKWNSIIHRCYDEKDNSYMNYGGRGIAISPEWRKSPELFIDYVESLSGYGEQGYTLDRVDNNGDYAPGNLRWADKQTQARNKRMSKRNKSGFRGVSWDRKTNKWRAQISIEERRTTIGYYTDKTEAAKAFDKVARENGYEESVLNIPIIGNIHTEESK